MYSRKITALIERELNKPEIILLFGARRTGKSTILNMLKKVEYEQRFSNLYFWRTYDGAEIDLIEEKDGSLYAYEFKWTPKRKVSLPKSFAEKYNVKGFKVITRENVFGEYCAS